MGEAARLRYAKELRDALRRFIRIDVDIDVVEVASPTIDVLRNRVVAKA